MRSRGCLALAVAALLVAAMPARATTRSVQVADVAFTPATLVADPGDTVEWTWVSGTHNVTAYVGASFASGDRSSGTFSAPFPGGAVGYVCTRHGFVTDGVCDGMCGVIREPQAPVPVPTITEPGVDDLLASPVTFAGRASSSFVDVLEEGTVIATAETDDAGGWSVSVPLGSGPHTVHAVGVTDDGTESAPSDPVSFTVDADPPTVTMTSPRHLDVIVATSIAVAGSAGDETSVEDVSVLLRNQLTGEALEVPVACDGCGTGSATWDGEIQAGAGVYVIEASARDPFGHVGSSGAVTILVV